MRLFCSRWMNQIGEFDLRDNLVRVYVLMGLDLEINSDWNNSNRLIILYINNYY